MVLRKGSHSSGGVVNDMAPVAELDHGCSRCPDAGAGQGEPLVRLVSEVRHTQQFGSSSSLLSQLLQK